MTNLFSREVEGNPVEVQRGFDWSRFRETKIETIAAEAKDLPKVGDSTDGGVAYSVNPEEITFEEIFEEDYGSTSTKITSATVKVKRKVIRKGFFGLRREIGSLTYASTINKIYVPKDEGWQARYDFLQSRKGGQK